MSLSPRYSVKSGGWNQSLNQGGAVSGSRSKLKISNSKPGGRLPIALLLGFVTVALTASRAWPVGASIFQAVTDRTTYDVGSEVKIRVGAVTSPSAASPIRLVASVRYRGSEGAAAPPTVRAVLFTAAKPPTGYLSLWKIPADATTGRYDVDLEVVDPVSGRAREGQARVVSFAVHRQPVRIDEVNLDESFYTSGDPVSVKVSLSNLSGKPMRGLRVEFSDRYWPWIAGPAEQAQASIVPITTALDLGVGPAATRTIGADHVAVAPDVQKPAMHQYGVVVWDHDRKQALAIAFSRMVFVDPPGVSSPRPYPPQYVYPDLSSVNVKNYRHFYHAGLDSNAILFDHLHTLFPTGAGATVNFALVNPTLRPWQAVHVEARLVDSGGKELSHQTVFESLNLEPGGASLRKSADFKLPDEAGLYRVEVQVTESSGEVIAHNDLELAADDLPKSIMVFCAHEDDEGGWHGLIRAAVENNIPIRIVYFTSGDAGSCDHYYEHFCGPAEALNFGEIRMQESRAVLEHLGVSPADILFLGLPDGGSGEIWYHHTNPSEPYLAVLLGSDHSPYATLAFPNLPYARDAVVNAAADIIQRLRPEVVVTAHPPAEGHIDHIVNNYFVVKALHQLAGKGSLPPGLKVFVDRVYDPKQIPATPYKYEDRRFYVSGEAAALSQEAGWYYESQGGNHALGNLRDFDQLSREVNYREVVDWNEHDGWNDKEPQAAAKLQRTNP
jgi:LmbE family N-acetylglucosaminyl deacetylase